MPRRWFLLAALLAGCSPSPTKFEQAVAKYNFIERNGAGTRDLCAQATAVEQLAADEGRDADYKSWKIKRDANCVMAELEPS